MPLRYGPSAGPVNDVLIAKLRNSTLQKDEGAPLYPTAKDRAGIDEWPEVQKLSEDLEEAKRKRDKRPTNTNRTIVSRLSAALYDLKEELYKRAVQRNRLEYFEKVDSLRAQGAPINDLVDSSTNPHKHKFIDSFPAAVCIGQLLGDQEMGCPQRPQTHSTLLLSFLRDRFLAVREVVVPLLIKALPIPPLSLSSSICFLCEATFSKRSNLTKHYRKNHPSSSFRKQFPCPQCTKENRHHLVTGAAEWSNHVEKAHGIAHAPTLEQPTRVSTRLPKRKSTDSSCLLCEHAFPIGNTFSRHTNSCHIGLFHDSFNCPECSRNNRKEKIDNFSMWLEHTSTIHGCDGQTGASVSVEEIRPRERVKTNSNSALPSGGKEPNRQLVFTGAFVQEKGRLAWYGQKAYRPETLSPGQHKAA
jgi:hypothetical protein